MTDPILTPKATLPLTTAIVVFDMSGGDPVPLAAVEIRSDLHITLKGAIKANCHHFMSAAQQAILCATQQAMAETLSPAPLDS